MRDNQHIFYTMDGFFEHQNRRGNDVVEVCGEYYLKHTFYRVNEPIVCGEGHFRRVLNTGDYCGYFRKDDYSDPLFFKYAPEAMANAFTNGELVKYNDPEVASQKLALHKRDLGLGS